LARISAAHEPLGPPPITATLSMLKNYSLLKTTSIFTRKVLFLKK